MTDVQQAAPVAQIDRDAAATLEAILRDVWDGYSSVHAIREGCADGSSIVQAFARHRLAATSLHDMQITPALSLPCKSGGGAGPDRTRLASIIDPDAALPQWRQFNRDAWQSRWDRALEKADRILALTSDATQTREAELVAALTEARLGFLALSGELDDETQLAWSKKHVAKIDTALSPQTPLAPPLSTDVQSAATGFHEQDVSLKVALPATGEVERAAVVAYIRRQSDRGADIGNEKPKGSTARAAFGGGSLALKRVADNIEAGEHILNDNAALATVAAANDEAFARGVEAAAKVCDEQRDFADANLKVQHRPAHYAGVRSAAIEGAIRIRRLLSQGGGKAERYRHVKRGTVYEVVGRAELQVNNIALTDGVTMVVYRGEDGKLWARESGEFNDGRFEPLATSRSQHQGASS